MLATLQYPYFRTLWTATVVNQLGQGMQQLLLGWLMFQMTGSAGLVGAVFAVRSAPNLAIGFVAGSITDRFDRRWLMRLSVWALGLVSAVVAVLLYLDRLEVWQLLVAALLMGATHAFYMTARQAYVYDLVGSGGAVNGIGLVTLSQQIGGIFGALLAGAVIQLFGAGTAFLVTAVSYCLGGIMFYGLRIQGEAAPQFHDPVWENLRGYLRALRTNRAMLSLMATTALAEILGFSHQVMLPVLADEVLHVGATGLGVLTAFRFLGGALGVFLVTALWGFRRRGLLLIATLVCFGIGQMLLSQSLDFWMAVLFIAFINVMASATDILHHTLLQLSVPNEQRGRAMGSWIVGLGTSPAGLLEVGYLSDLVSPRLALFANGIGLAGLAVILGVLLPRLRRM